MFLEYIRELDHSLVLFLNGLGSATFDSFWLVITNPYSWIPLFLVFFYIHSYTYKPRHLFYLIIVFCLVILVSLGLVDLIKHYFQRVRPIYNESLSLHLRKVTDANGFSFVSGHSTVSFATAVFMLLTLKSRNKWAYLVLLFPVLFAYSRLYLAVHFPTDILTGMFLGIIIGALMYRKVWLKLLKKQKVHPETLG